MRTELLPIEKIRADRRAQPRVEVDQLVVDDYAEAMRRGDLFPPVVVFANARQATRRTDSKRSSSTTLSKARMKTEKK